MAGPGQLPASGRRRAVAPGQAWSPADLALAPKTPLSRAAIPDRGRSPDPGQGPANGRASVPRPASASHRASVRGQVSARGRACARGRWTRDWSVLGRALVRVRGQVRSRASASGRMSSRGRALGVPAGQSAGIRGRPACCHARRGRLGRRQKGAATRIRVRAAGGRACAVRRRPPACHRACRGGPGLARAVRCPGHGAEWDRADCREFCAALRRNPAGDPARQGHVVSAGRADRRSLAGRADPRQAAARRSALAQPDAARAECPGDRLRTACHNRPAGRRHFRPPAAGSPGSPAGRRCAPVGPRAGPTGPAGLASRALPGFGDSAIVVAGHLPPSAAFRRKGC